MRQVKIARNRVDRELIRAHGRKCRLHPVEFSLVADPKPVAKDPGSRVDIWIFGVAGNLAMGEEK